MFSILDSACCDVIRRVNTIARDANDSSLGLLEIVTTEANGDEMMSIHY